jgi:glucose-6-phosphate dehydrogenase assembly protein OpcA
MAKMAQSPSPAMSMNTSALQEIQLNLITDSKGVSDPELSDESRSLNFSSGVKSLSGSRSTMIWRESILCAAV